MAINLYEALFPLAAARFTAPPGAAFTWLAENVCWAQAKPTYLRLGMAVGRAALAKVQETVDTASGWFRKTGIQLERVISLAMIQSHQAPQAS